MDLPDVRGFEGVQRIAMMMMIGDNIATDRLIVSRDVNDIVHCARKSSTHFWLN